MNTCQSFPSRVQVARTTCLGLWGLENWYFKYRQLIDEIVNGMSQKTCCAYANLRERKEPLIVLDVTVIVPMCFSRH